MRKCSQELLKNKLEIVVVIIELLFRLIKYCFFDFLNLLIFNTLKIKKILKKYQ